MEETKKCPYCGKEIMSIAKKCRYCGRWVDGSDETQTSNNSMAINSQFDVIDYMKIHKNNAIICAIIFIGILIIGVMVVKSHSNLLDPDAGITAKLASRGITLGDQQFKGNTYSIKVTNNTGDDLDLTLHLQVGYSDGTSDVENVLCSSDNFLDGQTTWFIAPSIEKAKTLQIIGFEIE